MSKIDDQMVGLFQWIDREQWRQLDLPPGDTVMDGCSPGTQCRSCFLEAGLTKAGIPLYFTRYICISVHTQQKVTLCKQRCPCLYLPQPHPEHHPVLHHWPLLSSSLSLILCWNLQPNKKRDQDDSLVLSSKLGEKPASLLFPFSRWCLHMPPWDVVASHRSWESALRWRRGSPTNSLLHFN